MIFPRKRRGFVSPRRWKVRAWRTRRSFTWIAGSASPISSRKTVPKGSQVSSQPARSWRAPVKAPRRWPNSSDSMRVGERAERWSGWKRSPKCTAKRRAGQSEEVLAVGAELLVERDAPAGVARVGRLHHEVQQSVLVAGVEEVEDDVLVQHAIRFGRLGAGGEAFAKKRGERRRPLG